MDIETEHKIKELRKNIQQEINNVEIHLIKCINEINTKIDNLKAKIQELDNRTRNIS